MVQQSCTVGVDLGTTSAKAIAYDDMGRVIATSGVPVTTIVTPDQGAEQDPLAVASAAAQATASAITAARARGYQVTHVGFSAAMHSLVALDEHDQPLTNAMLWMDARPRLLAEALWRLPEGKALYERTGTPIHAMSPLAKLLWMREARPDIFHRSRRFVSLKEWIWHAWFGFWQIDASLASATGLYNLQTGDWDAEALTIAQITPAQLSTIVPTTMVVHTGDTPTLRAIAIERGTLCVIGASDGVLANLAAGALDARSMTLTLGTSCALRVGCVAPMTNPAIRSFCYVLDHGRFIVGGPSNSGGVVLEWLYQSFSGSHEPSGFEALLAQASQISEDVPLCLPYLHGERAPLWNAASSLTLHGVRAHHTPAHLLRAAIEGIAFNTCWIAEELFSLVGKPTQIIATGKVLEPPWICQLFADICGLPLAVDTVSDASALGAAQLARIATGASTWDDGWGHSASHVTYAPVASERYAAAYQEFRRIAALLYPTG